MRVNSKQLEQLTRPVDAPTGWAHDMPDAELAEWLRRVVAVDLADTVIARAVVREAAARLDLEAVIR